MNEKRPCVLCGYEYPDYVIHNVPLSSPPKDNVVCLDCVDELHELAAEYEKAYETRLRLSQEAQEG